MNNLLYSDGKYIYIAAEYAEMYVPEDIIQIPDGEPKESWVAYEYGSGFNLIGIAYMRFFKDENQKRDDGELHTLMYPNMIETHPSDTVSKVDLEINGITDRYRVLKYYKNDILMEATSRKAATNCEAFMKLLTAGKIPRSLTYDEVYDCWMKNYQINGMTPNAPAVVIQAIIAEMYRDPNDPATQFSKLIGKNPKIDPRSYLPMNMNTASAYSTVMSSLSFERFGEKLTSAINMTKDGIENKKSPIEAVITM